MASHTHTTKVAVIGASGYSGAELLRRLLVHPGADLVCLTSRSYAGKSCAEVFPRFAKIGNADTLEFIDPQISAITASGAELAFLALPHGVASEFAIPLLEAGLKIIDLSADYRLHNADTYKEFYDHDHPAPELLEESVYGLPEIHGDNIKSARLIASPGCYPTSIILPLIPTLTENLIDPRTIHVTSMSGASGAGKSANVALLFAEVNESVRAYSVPKHRHLSEIEQELSIAAGEEVKITFIPHLMPVTAGIHTSTVATARPGTTAADLTAALEKAYADAPFVRLLGEGAHPDTKNVTGSNFIDIAWHLDPRTNRVILLSAEDNLGKGAASQAIQSFNLVTGQEKATGLDWV
jgi:N-acetyl-gamma-glutamyl-phosphate reductase